MIQTASSKDKMPSIAATEVSRYDPATGVATQDAERKTVHHLWVARQENTMPTASRKSPIQQ